MIPVFLKFSMYQSYAAANFTIHPTQVFSEFLYIKKGCVPNKLDPGGNPVSTLETESVFQIVYTPSS